MGDARYCEAFHAESPFSVMLVDSATFSCGATGKILDVVVERLCRELESLSHREIRVEHRGYVGP